ncbi:MAG: nickel pincer cofactor biosynthesis protein LarB [Candidatus Altiarchaeota archaeon]
MNYNLDYERQGRCGIPEVVYGAGKTVEDLVGIADTLLKKCGRILVTKVDEGKVRKLRKKFRAGSYRTAYNQRGSVLVIKKKGFKIKSFATVGILTAGTSDIPIAEEARVIAEELGLEAVAEYDVGVAGIHRVYPALERMKDAGALIVIAGMEGALPSVVSGLTDIPVIGVPTSVGYGTSFGGQTALYTMLNSCTPVAVVNIDNGYGAAILAYKMLRKNGRA